MPDREKVIRDLEYLISFGGASQQSMVMQIAINALALLKQETVEPYQHDAVWLCGNCEKEVVGWDDDIDGKEYRYPFCRQCGRSVKWE